MPWSGCQELLEGLHRAWSEENLQWAIPSHGYPAREGISFLQNVMQDAQILFGVQFYQMEGELGLPKQADCLFWSDMLVLHSILLVNAKLI